MAYATKGTTMNNDFTRIYRSCRNHGNSRPFALFTAARMWRSVKEARDNSYPVFWKPCGELDEYSPAHPDIVASWNYYSVVPTKKGWVPAPWLGTSDNWLCAGCDTLAANDAINGVFADADEALAWFHANY